MKKTKDKELEIKCCCECRNTLYLSYPYGKNTLMIGSGDKDSNSEVYSGVVLHHKDIKKVIEFLKDCK